MSIKSITFIITVKRVEKCVMSEPAVMSIFPKVNTTTCISINIHVPGVCNKLAVVFSEYYYPQTIAWQQSTSYVYADIVYIQVRKMIGRYSHIPPRVSGSGFTFIVYIPSGTEPRASKWCSAFSRCYWQRKAYDHESAPEVSEDLLLYSLVKCTVKLPSSLAYS